MLGPGQLPGRVGLLPRGPDLLLPPRRDLAQALVRGEHFGGGQPAAGQRGGAVRVGVALHPGAPLRLLAAAPHRLGVQREDRLVHLGAQLPRGQPRRGGQDRRLHRGRVPGGQRAERVQQDPRPRQVDPAGLQRGGDGRPPGQVQRQPDLRLAGALGQRQRHRHLIGHELAQLGRELPRRRGRGAVGRAAPGQLGDHRQLPRLRPRGQPPPRPQHPDQPVIIQRPRSRAGLVGEPGQADTGRQHIQRTAVGEPGPAPGPVPGHEPGRARLRHRRRPGGGQLVQLGRSQAGQLRRAAAVRVGHRPRVVAGRDVGGGERGQRGGQDVLLGLGLRGHAFTSVRAGSIMFFEHVIA